MSTRDRGQAKAISGRSRRAYLKVVRNSPLRVYVSGNDVILFMFLMDHHSDK